VKNRKHGAFDRVKNALSLRQAADSPAADQSRPRWIKVKNRKHHAFDRVQEAHRRAG